MTKVVKKYTGTLREQLAAYREDRSATDFLFHQDCEAARYPTPTSRKRETHEHRDISDK